MLKELSSKANLVQKDSNGCYPVDYETVESIKQFYAENFKLKNKEKDLTSSNTKDKFNKDSGHNDSFISNMSGK